MRKKIYLSGSITKDPHYKEKFNTAEKELSNKYHVVNPIKLEHNHDKTWKSYMMECLKSLKGCEYIVNIDTKPIRSIGRDLELKKARDWGIKEIRRNKQ